MWKKLLTYLFLAIVIALPYSCKEKCIKGDGFRKGFERNVAPFIRVDLQISATVNLVEDTSEIPAPIVVSAESNIADHIVTDVKDSTLRIFFDGCIENHNDIIITVPYRTLASLTVSGSGDYNTERIIEQDSLSVIINGSGTANLTVKTGFLTCEISGNGKANISGAIDTLFVVNNSNGVYNGYENLTIYGDVINNSSGKIYVRIRDLLSVRINGSGNVYFKDHPVIDSTLTGSGKLINDN